MVSVFKKTGLVAFMTHKNKDPREKRKVAKTEVENLISKFQKGFLPKITENIIFSKMAPLFIRQIWFKNG